MKATVAVTGTGLVSPLGQDMEEVVAALAGGKGCLQTIDSYTPGRTVAAAKLAVENNFANLVTGRGLKYHSRGTLMLSQAGLQALQAAGLDPAAGPTPISLLVGSKFGNWNPGLDYIYRLVRDGMDTLQPMDAIDTTANSSVDFCAIQCKIRGVVKMITTGACSSHDAIIEGARLVAEGRAQQVLVAGFERLSPKTLAVFEARGLLRPAACADNQQERPYCRNSRGMIPGEGAAALLLENEQSARRRGVRILARILGGDFAFSPHDQLTDSARSLARVGRQALKTAGCPPSSIDWVCGTANGFPDNDCLELLALQDLFGDQPRSPAISSLKGFWGDALGASGAMAAVAAVGCLGAGFIPSTPGLETPWPEASGLDLVTGPARARVPSRLLILSTDADGSCAALVIGK